MPTDAPDDIAPAGAAGAAAEAPLALSGADIVCLGPAEFGVIHAATEYTMFTLARENRVIYVEPFASWITLLRTARLQRRERGNRPRLEQVRPNLWVYRPPAIGLPGITRLRAASDINGWILARLLRGVCAQLGFRDPIVFSPLYNSGGFLRHFPSRLRVFENQDYDAALARDEAHKRLVLALEADTCRAADLCFAVTDELADIVRQFNPNVHPVYCGAALEVYGRALDPAVEVPEPIARLPKPVIGYLGGVDPWKIDTALLRHIAKARPDWSIALVGYVWWGFDPSVFADCPNIHVLGPQAYDDLPRYVKGMDVGVLPFPLNDITKNGDAVKTYEYLAAGRPVVSTSVPAARRLSPPVRIAATPDAFIAAIEATLAEPQDPAALHAAVVPHSWEQRARQKAVIMRRALDGDPSATRPRG
jgi:glycosyltransferase involved in cell wall biosynthesis